MPDLNITASFAHHARALAGKPALVHGERAVLYRELDPLVRRAAAHLYALGLKAGDVAGVALKDSIEHIIVLCAMARAGIVIVPIDWRWTPEEQARVSQHFGARMVFDEELIGKELDCNVVFPEGDIPLLMSLSSGTTGRPKGPRLTHSQFMARYRVFSINLGFHSQDRFLSATPLYYGGGRTFALAMLYMGGTVVMLPPPYEASELCEALEIGRASCRERV